MTKITKEEVNETLFNLGKMSARLPSDEGKRLFMMGDVLNKYISQLEKRPAINKNDGLVCAKCYGKLSDDFDMDGRC